MGSLNATDGSQTVAIKLAASDPRTIYVTQSAARSSAGLQIAEWEQTMNALHAKEMPTDNYGFDRYCDFHLGHAHVAGTLDPIITKLKSYSGKYRFFVPPNGELAILSRALSRCLPYPASTTTAGVGGTEHFLYIAAPGGLCVQYTGTASAALAPANETFYDFCSGH